MKSRKARKADERVTALVNRFAPGSQGTNKTLRVTLVRSEIGGTERQRATLRCLGLGKRGSQSLIADTPQARGRIRAVAHLIEVEEAS
ncbi:MAG TPA: 50S ribosomal protein L30 [Candidatus Binatia bacterium]